jgi:sugar phosphate isomerase/epimerase
MTGEGADKEMKLAFSTNAFTRHPLTTAIRRIADVGYEGVEVLADHPHAFLDERWAETESLKTALRDCGLSVSNINANTASGFYLPGKWEDPFEPSLSNPDPALRRWRVAYTQRCVDLAAILNCRSVSVTSGGMPSGATGPAAPEEMRWRESLFTESLQEILDYAQTRGVFLGIEYEPGLLVGDAAATLKFLDILKSPYLGVNLDIGHAEVAGENIAEVIHRFGSRILNIHVEDIQARRHDHLIPGLGDIDFDALIAVLKKIDYRNYLTVELYPYVDTPAEAAAAALSFLQDVLAKSS